MLCSLWICFPLYVAEGLSGTYPVSIEVCLCDHRIKSSGTLQVCVLCRFQDAFNLAQKLAITVRAVVLARGTGWD